MAVKLFDFLDLGVADQPRTEARPRRPDRRRSCTKTWPSPPHQQSNEAVAYPLSPPLGVDQGNLQSNLPESILKEGIRSGTASRSPDAACGPSSEKPRAAKVWGLFSLDASNIESQVVEFLAALRLISKLNAFSDLMRSANVFQSSSRTVSGDALRRIGPKIFSTSISARGAPSWEPSLGTGPVQNQVRVQGRCHHRLVQEFGPRCRAIEMRSERRCPWAQGSLADRPAGG